MKSRSLVLLVPALLFLGLTGVTHARLWTSNDGKTLEAEWVSTAQDQVTLRRPDGQVFTLPLNRLSAADQSWVKQQAAAPAVAEVKPIGRPFGNLITGSWALSEHDGLKFAVYGGKSFSAENKYPLVLALHGKSPNTENGKQVAGWMNSFSKKENEAARPCFVVAPLSAQPAAGEGRGWNGDEVEQVIKLVKALVKNLPVDPKRVYIVGHSMGGFGTCHVMASEPRLFAAAIPVSGVSQGDAGTLDRKPVWMFHAADDNVVPVAGARDFAEAMKKDKQFKYTESPTGGHGVVGPVFNNPETHQWLFAQQLK
jgi:predicted peptidase